MQNRSYRLYSFFFLMWIPVAFGLSSVVWSGHLSDSAGKAVSGAVVKLHSAAAGHDYSATTRADGAFAFADLPSDRYELFVSTSDKQWKAEVPLVLAKESSAA